VARTIIVPLDGTEPSKRALEPARALARQSGGALVLVMARAGGVVEPQRYLRSVADRAGIDARAIAFEDRTASAAVATLGATEPGAIVCMTTHARDGAGRAALGSVAEEIVRHTEVPLVLVGPNVDATASDFAELIVCLDGSRTADAILPVAAQLAADLDLAVWLVEVVDPQLSGDTEAATGGDTSESGRLQHLAHELAGAGLSVNWETLHGDDPAASIVGFAKRRPSPLLAMTTHGRTGLARVAAGSVAMGVVHRAPCPVLVTRSRALPA
jgi:nucleotide-binding universal stress UspA family protein